MDSSCSFTMESNCCTLIMSYSKFVLVLLATYIVYSSVSIPFLTPEPASSQHQYQPHLSHQYQPHLSHLYQPQLRHLYQPHLCYQYHPYLSHQYQPHLSTCTSLISATSTSLISATMPGADPGFQKRGGGGGGGGRGYI